MAGASVLEDDFEVDRRAGEPAFKVDLDGFEGPLDLLLELARRQKVDLVRISILELANQYLAFVEAARELRLELAADYLVMAAWLAYLKSRLLLPVPPKAEAEDAAGLADALARRPRRLEPNRRAAAPSPPAARRSQSRRRRRRSRSRRRSTTCFPLTRAKPRHARARMSASKSA